MFSQHQIPVGIYEKAFPDDFSWEQILSSARLAGYDFVEMSIDESSERLDRLNWSLSDRAVLRQAIYNTGVPIWGMGISAHRKFPLGSAASELRKQGLDILSRSIDLAADLGVRVIQIMGYDVFYEPSSADTQARFLDGLRTGALWASSAGMVLALENVDCERVDSVEKAMRYVKKINSPWFQVYPDLGNMTAAGYDPLEQLPLGEGHLVGVHVKDVRKGELRGVPLGKGIVRFQEAFRLLARMGFAGPIVMEMWAQYDATGDPIKAASQARSTLADWISETLVDSQPEK